MRRLLSILTLAWIALAFSGCATTSDSENLSERPWNTPKSWEHGLPGGFGDQRY